jgi:polyisoprenoid-binding protein YceI
MIKKLVAIGLALAAGTATAAPVTYVIDPAHTYPSFEADHMGGQSIWRGKFNRTTGKVVLDVAAKTGDVDITVDTSSINFGMDALNEHAKGPDMFDVAKFPTAVYKGKFSKWNGDVPVEIDGQFTLKGVTKPLKLTIKSFLCKPSPMTHKEVCGADASASFNRDEWGMDYAKSLGFKMKTKLLISIEAAPAG